MYIGVLVLLLLWKQGVPAFNLSLRSINVYTVLFVLFFGIGYGAYYATADMPIPMVADCSDYETYRSGQYVPGIMGTLFSLVDKLVSSDPNRPLSSSKEALHKMHQERLPLYQKYAAYVAVNNSDIGSTVKEIEEVYQSILIDAVSD